VLFLPAAILLERQPALGFAAGAAEIGRERRQVLEGDVALDLDRIRAQQVAQEPHLHGLGLEVVDDELAHVAGADAVVDRIVEPVRLAQDRRQPRLADAGHAEHRHSAPRRVREVFR
jgi:hypothetical protein